MERMSLSNSNMDTASDITSYRGEEISDNASTASAAGRRAVVEDKVFVAVGREIKASKSTLIWALQNAGTKKVVIVHVHQPAQTISILGGKFPISQLGEREVNAHQETKREEVCKILEEYLRMSSKAGVQAEKEYIEMASIEKGIVELINQFRIGKLVMGAAADNKYSRKMIEPKSKKAVYVRQHAPPSCHIWFVCKGRLIYTRERTVSCSPSPSPYDSSKYSTPWSRSVAGESYDELEQSSTMSISLSSGLSPQYEASVSSAFSSMRAQERERGLPLLAFSPSNVDLGGPSISNSLVNSMNDRLYEQLEQAMTEAETSKRQAFEESIRRRKAEKDTMDALHKVRLAEDLCFDELRQRKEVEEELTKSKEELKKVKHERDGILEKFQVALDQKALLESRLERSDTMVKEMEEKLISVMELLKNYKKN